MKHVIVIGRGHSGTRLIPKALIDNGFYWGPQVSISGEYWGPSGKHKFSKTWNDLIDVCMTAGRYVTYAGGTSWNFDCLVKGAIPKKIKPKLDEFYAAVTGELIGWKQPELTLIYPWLVRLYPEAFFIHVIRDPRNIGFHGTDRIYKYKVPVGSYRRKKQLMADDETSKSVSIKYQFDIVETIRPKYFLRVKFEDLVAGDGFKQVGKFLGKSLYVGLKLDKSKAVEGTSNCFILNSLAKKYGYNNCC